MEEIAADRGTVVRDTETFMKMGSAGIGLGRGVEDFRAGFVFPDQARLAAFITQGTTYWKDKDLN